MSKTNQAVVEAYTRGYRVLEDGTVINPSGKELKCPEGSNGYKRFSISCLGGIRPIFVHKLQAYQKFGNLVFSTKSVVRHLNGNKLDNSFNNIEIGSSRDNYFDIPESKRVEAAKKTSASLKKLTLDQVNQIREEVKSGATHSSVANKYCISRSFVTNIVNKKLYNS